MDVQDVMRKLAAGGITVLVKTDHERLLEGGDYWTLVLSGPMLQPAGFARGEEATLEECFASILSWLRSQEALTEAVRILEEALEDGGRGKPSVPALKYSRTPPTGTGPIR